MSNVVNFAAYGFVDNRDLLAFPTRRSSDLCRSDRTERREIRARLAMGKPDRDLGDRGPAHARAMEDVRRGGRNRMDGRRDRKSTRLNSSHRCISYAVFCLKKKMISVMVLIK